MSLLSDEQAQEIFKSEHCNISKDLAGILYRAIEAAVLEAQAGQEPVAFIETVNPRDGSFRKSLVWKKHPKPSSAWCTEYTPLYAAPVVQPDMVMVPRWLFDSLSADADKWREANPVGYIAAAEQK